MKKIWLVVLSVLTAFFTSLPTTVRAEETAAFTLKAGATMKDVLSEQTGKKAALRLKSGEEIEGTVTLVGNSLVHISKLAGKEFFDAVVSIEDISAVRFKARER